MRATHQVDAVEDLHLTDLVGAWVGEVAVVVIDGQCAKAGWVGWCVTYRVKHLHVPDVVDVQTLLQAHDQPLRRTGRKAMAVVTYS